MLNSIAFVGSEGPHISKFLNFFSNYFEKIILITNKIPENTPLNCTVYKVDFSFKKIWNIYISVKKIKEILEKEQPEIIHIHQANSYAFYSLLANINYRIPTVLNLWGSDILLLPQKNIFLRQMVKFNLLHSDIIIAESFFETLIVRNILGKVDKNIRLVNFGVYDDYLVDIGDLLKDKENIIFSNRLHNKIYRVDKIIDSFGRLIKSGLYTDWKLVIAGEGEETLRLKTLVKNNALEDYVSFVGWLDKNLLKKWYLKSKIFISVPVSDGVPISLLEAMACGCLPVVSNVPSVLEFLIDGINAIVVENINSLDLYIRKAIELTNNKDFVYDMISLNRKIIQRHGVYSKNMKKYLDIYNELLSKE